MSERIRKLAYEVAREGSHAGAHPKVAALGSKRGDLSALAREIVEETAYSLGKAARRLEESLEALRALGAELDAAREPEERKRLVERFNAQRAHVLQRLLYVRIQREALGFVQHDELDRHYPVPPKAHF
jgi:hypothetical protein